MENVTVYKMRTYFIGLEIERGSKTVYKNVWYKNSPVVQINEVNNVVLKDSNIVA
jgi:hypothetical protein